MSRIAYVNGCYLSHRSAVIHVEDRGFQFADGVYEVCEVCGGGLVDERRHLERLDRSLRELRIEMPMSHAALDVVLRETVRRNGVINGIVYMQVTRGVARRDHAFPPAGTPPTLVVTARSLDVAAREKQAATGIKVISVPENRWTRVDIKSIGLLPNVLAKQAAKEAGGREAWFVDVHGHVTEGASSNAWIVTREGQIVTRSADEGILRGITRTVVLEEAAALGYQIVERPFTLAEVHDAAEAFITAASTLVMPVIDLDGAAIGDGRPGPVATALRQRFHNFTEISGAHPCV